MPTVLKQQRRAGREWLASIAPDIEKLNYIVAGLKPLLQLPNADLLPPARRAMKALGCRINLLDGESEVRQLRAFLEAVLFAARQLLRGADPLDDIVGDITREQHRRQCEADAERREAERQQFVEKYGRKCACGKRTKEVHPILDVLCCANCRDHKPEFRMIYNTTAIKRYGLTKLEIAILRQVHVPNPHWRSGPPASLVMVRHVEELLASREIATKMTRRNDATRK